MLADDFTSFVASDLARVGLPPQISAPAHFISDTILQSSRYALDRDSVHVIQTISTLPPSKVLHALKACRLTAPAVWVEFSFSDRLSWLEGMPEDWKQTHGYGDEPPQRTSAPERMGLLLRQLDGTGRLIEITSVWRHRENHEEEGRDVPYAYTNLCMVLDTRDEDPAPMPHGGEALVLRTFREQRPPWLDRPGELEAALKMEARLSVGEPQFSSEFWSFARQALPAERVKEIRRMSMFDLLGEWQFALGFLMAFNSRNILALDPAPDLSRLNKARARRGKSPLLSIAPVRLKLSKVQMNRLSSLQSVTTQRDIMLHAVRGHWKLRRTGLFWWMPHIRGGLKEMELRTPTGHGPQI